VRSGPHLVAPGGDATLPLQGLGASGKIGAIGHGTSFAAPHITGALALLLERDPAATPDQLRTTLLSMCAPITGANAVAQGAGLLRFP
jgi:serine protease AprX